MKTDNKETKEKETGTENTDVDKGRTTAKRTGATDTTDKGDDKAEKKETRLQQLKKHATEDDPKPSPTLTLRKIIGGDILYAELVRSQIWAFLLIVLFTIIYVAFRYQCQQDMIMIDKLQTQLKDAKYKALSSSSTLTERYRESRVLELLRQNKDSLLHIAEQPPYIIITEE